MTIVPFKHFTHTCTVYVGLAQACPNYSFLFFLRSFLVIYRPTLKITPSTSTHTLGVDDELVSLNCSVLANPLPLITWARLLGNVNETVIGRQAPTWFMKTAYSVLTVNITELGVGYHAFLCNVSVETPAGYYTELSFSIAANIIVQDPLDESYSTVTTDQAVTTDEVEPTAPYPRGKYICTTS